MKTLTANTVKISDQALKKGEELDREVEEALQEDREGKTIQASSIREAVAKYDAQENSEN